MAALYYSNFIIADLADICKKKFHDNSMKQYLNEIHTDLRLQYCERGRETLYRKERRLRPGAEGGAAAQRGGLCAAPFLEK